MILLDEFDDCAPLKSPEAQLLPRTEPQEQQPPVQSQQQVQQGDLPPPYSRPNTPAPQPERRQDSDIEANSERSRERSRRKKRRSFAHSAKKYAVWGLGTLLFMMIWRFLLFNRVDWMQHVDEFYKSVPPPPPRKNHVHDHPSFPGDAIRTPSRPVGSLPPLAGDNSGTIYNDDEHSTKTLQAFCVSNASWSDTIRYSKEKIPYHSSDTSLQLPVDSKLLFVVARTPRSSGRLQILRSAIPDEMARVYVTARYENGKSIDDLSACLMERHPGEIGVGIFTPQRSNNDASFDIDINLLLPPPLFPDFAYNLHTDLTEFSQDVGPDMRFESLHLRSRGMPIVGRKIQVREATIETSSAPIFGSDITASRLLSLKTTGHPIHANVTLRSISSFLSVLEIESTNSSVDANVHLDHMTPPRLPTQPRYEVRVNASNTELTMTFPSAPGDAILDIDAVTSKKPTLITLPPSFEGSFSLITTEKDKASVESRHSVDLSISHRLDNGNEIVRGFVGSPNVGRVNIMTKDAVNKLIV
ncbi:hypothetical protein VNI00_004128 [Paramarasmius palmivorus]|uniref:DUF7330 domain-containing protein n=1 Tax=Paramarasmius palmivorus TaxID=297713 RepID=A0AAW0DNX1_9AGAR